MESLKVKIDGKEHVVRMEEDGGKIKVHLEGKSYVVETSLAAEQKDYGLVKEDKEAKAGAIRANLPGIIYSVDVKEGSKIKRGQKLITLVAMKMENQISSPIDGKVKKVMVKKNDKVNKGDILLEIE